MSETLSETETVIRAGSDVITLIADDAGVSIYVNDTEGDWLESVWLPRRAVRAVARALEGLA